MTLPVGWNPTKSGFTLLELLVGLALIAVIGVTMAAAIGQLRPIRAFEQRLTEQRTADAIADVVERDLMGTLRLPLLENGLSSNVLISGDRQKIVFTAIVPTGFQRRGLREVSYELLDPSGRAKLVRSIRLRRLSASADVLPQADELLSGPLDLQLRYLTPTDDGRLEWQADFHVPNRMPRAVTISVAVGAGQRVKAMRTVSLPTELAGP